jgi:phage tail sheath protein FI
MATFSRPGVYVQEVSLPQQVGLPDTSASVGAMAGALSKGDATDPQLLQSWGDFVKTFGGLNDTYPLTWAAYNFFANGGGSLYVRRITGAGALPGTITFINQAASTTTLTGTVTAASAASGTVTYTASNTFASGQTVTITGLSTAAFNLTGVTIASASSTQFTVTNAATGTAVTGATATATVTITATPVFTLNAINAGTWSGSYSAQVVPAGVGTRFGLNIYYTVGSATSLVESFTDLSMTSTDKYYFKSVIDTTSSTVRVSASGISTTAFPYTASTTPTAFSGGADGAALVRADYSAAWPSFDPIQNPLLVYAADAPYAATSTLTAQIHGDAMIYAGSRDDAFVIIDTPSGLSVSAAKAQVTATMAIGAAATTGNIAAAYYPWVNIPDGNKIPGAVHAQAPGAAMVGQFLATDKSRGVFKTPAGLGNKIALAVSTEHQFTNAELDDINTYADPINAIRNVPGAGIVVMGGRTMDNTPSNRYINIRRSLTFIEKQAKDLSAFAVFENNDSLLWNNLRTGIGNFLLNYWQQGGLRGNSPTEAYFIKVDETTTTWSDIQNGRVNIEIGVALQYPAEFVVIRIGQLTGNATA